MLTRAGRPRRRARPLRAARAVRRDRPRAAEKVPAALDAGLQPILCVGETRGRARGRRHRAQAAPPGAGRTSRECPTTQLADVVIAYEPIWAIGTGLVADARAGPGGGALRARARRRPLGRQAARRCAILYGGSRQVRQRGRAARRCRTSTARSSAAPRWRPSRSRRSCAAAGPMRLARQSPTTCPLQRRSPGGARRLGARARRARATRSSLARHADLRRAAAPRYPHTRSTACGRAVGLPDGPDGQQRGRAPQLRRRRASCGRTSRASTTRSPTARSRRTRAAAAVARRRASGGAPARPRLRRRRALSLDAPARAASTLAARARRADVVVHAFLDGRDTPPDVGRRLRRAGRGLAARSRRRTRSATVIGRYWAMDRDNAGTASSAPTTCSCTGAARTRADSGAGGRARRLRARRDRRVRRAARRRRRRRGSAPATRVLCFNFRPDRARELTRALAEPGFDEFDRGGAAAARALRVHDASTTRLALPGRVPAGALRRYARRGARRARR